MNLVAIACVKNEVDIIEAFVRHNLEVANQLVVLDNGSTDGTLDVLRALEQDGLALHIVEDPTPGHLQWQRMTRLMHEHAVARLHADWVLALDADEFVVMVDGESPVPAGASTQHPVSLFWKTFVPTPGDDPAQLNPVRRIRHRLLQEPVPSMKGPIAWNLKVMVPSVLAGRPDGALEQGNHAFGVAGVRIDPRQSDCAFIAHFPVRNPGQLLARIAIKQYQQQAMVVKLRSLKRHRHLYEAIRQDPMQFAGSIYHDAALLYTGFGSGRRSSEPRPIIEDPISYRGGPITRTPVIEDRSHGMRDIFDYAESLAVSYASLTQDKERLNSAHVDLCRVFDESWLEIARLDQEKSQLVREKTVLAAEMRQLVEQQLAMSDEHARLAQTLDCLTRENDQLRQQLVGQRFL